MKLTMWILKDWLAKYKPDAYIKKGEPVLCNIRLFSAGRKLSANTVYLSRDGVNRILCVNGEDILALHADDLDEIFNSILDAFEYYNEWENQLNILYHAQGSIDELLAHCHDILHRTMAIGDLSYYLTNIYGADDMIEAVPSFRSIIENRSISLDSIFRINSDARVRSDRMATYLVDALEYANLGAVSNLFCNGKLLGWFVTCKPSGHFTQGELDLQDAATRAIQKWLKNNSYYEEHMNQSGILLDILLGETDRNKVLFRLETFGWKQDDTLQVYVIRTPDEKIHSEHVLERLLKNLDNSILLLRYDDDLLLLKNTSISNVPDFEEKIKNILTGCKSVAGKSGLFTDVRNLKTQYEAAKIALDYGWDTGNQITCAEEIKLHYAASLIRENTAMDILHPAIAKLEAYDQSHHACLNDTLRTFITYRYNIAETAKALHLHRSTLLYRLERIQSLTDVDYYDFPTLLHLGLSYFLLDGCRDA